MATGDVSQKIPKYSLLEIEKRMLVDPSLLPDLSGLESRLIEDRYFEFGRMRLRKISQAHSSVIVYKLCKKYGKINRLEEPITNLYLSEAEYAALLSLPGNDLVKRRYRYEFQGEIFSIDKHAGALAGLYLLEKESETGDVLRSICFPPFAVIEVTEDVRYNGDSLA